MSEAIPRNRVEHLAGKFRMLADATRLTILACLMTGKEKNVGEVAAATGRTTANVSKHLKLLADDGILSRRKDGLQVFYRLHDPVWEQVCRLVSNSVHKDADR
jgi:ArsR family transcriptional regulator